MVRTTPRPDVPPDPAPTDEELVRQVLAGDRALYAELLRRHNRRIYRVARAIVRDEAEAEDVMQDAYVRAYEHLAEFQGRASWVTWLTRIAVHEALARVRRQRREVLEEPMSMTIADASPSPEKRAGNQELGRLLEAAVETLPPAFRAVFVLREVEGLDVADTAASLQIREETVKTRLHRARRLLRTRIEQQLGESAAEVYAFPAVRCDRVVAAVMVRLADRPPGAP